MDKSETEQTSGISVLDLLIVLGKYKKLILGSSLGLGVGLAVLLQFSPNTYTARTKLLPPQQSSSAASALLGGLNNLGIGGLIGGVGLADPSKVYVAMLTSRTLGDRMIKRFNLKEHYESSNMTQAFKELEGATTVNSGKDNLITIEVEDKDPKLAAKIANGYVDELVGFSQELALTESSLRRRFYEKQVKKSQLDLMKAETGLKQVQERTGLIQLDGQAQLIIGSIANFRAQIAAKEVQLGSLRTYATDENPEVVRIQEELRLLRNEASKLERKQSQTTQGDVFVASGQVPQLGLEYVRAVRDVKYYEKIYELLAQQYELAKLDEARDQGLIQVLDKALVPEKRSGPSRVTLPVAVTILVFILTSIYALIADNIARANETPANRLKLEKLRSYWSWKRG